MALFREIAIADPTAIEERVAEASLVFGLNSYRELCGLHFGGVTMTSSQLLIKCATRGARQAKYIVDMIKGALKRDEDTRANGCTSSFTECVRLNKITSLAQNRLPIKLKRFRMDKCTKSANDASSSDDENQEDDEEDEDELKQMDDKSAALVPKKPKWIPDSDFENSDSDTAINAEANTLNADDDNDAMEQDVKPKIKPRQNVTRVGAISKPKKRFEEILKKHRK